MLMYCQIIFKNFPSYSHRAFSSTRPSSEPKPTFFSGILPTQFSRGYISARITLHPQRAAGPSTNPGFGAAFLAVEIDIHVIGELDCDELRQLAKVIRSRPDEMTGCRGKNR